MIWVVTAALSVALAELFLRLPFLANANIVMDVAARSLRVMRARGVSDHWKERCMMAYSGRMLRQTVVLTGWFALWGAAAAALVWGLGFLSPGLDAFLLEPAGLALAFGASVAYVVARRRLVR